MTTETLLKFDRVSKIFGKNRVVNELSLDIKKGEFLAILGPSGCGKTTSLRMIAGLERCDEGEITFEGRIVDSVKKRQFVPSNKRGMGMVFQSYAIWPHMNVFENVAYPLKVRRVNKNVIKTEVERVLELVGLSEMSARKATLLSGGQQQRVALARSLVFHPSILLLDEPFSNLDAKLRELMRLEVKQLQQKLGITIVFVTHDQVEALSLADRIVMMNKGEIEQIGSPEQIYEEPKTAFVRDFVGKNIRFRAVIVSIDANREIEVVRDGADDIRYRTKEHHFTEPKVGDICFISTRSEYLMVEPTDVVQAKTEQTNSLRFHGKIETLLFIGDQFEALIELSTGRKLHLYLPKTYKWHEGQNIVLRLNRGVSVWPE